jgi:hypothetical protein
VLMYIKMRRIHVCSMIFHRPMTLISPDINVYKM